MQSINSCVNKERWMFYFPYCKLFSAVTSPREMLRLPNADKAQEYWHKWIIMPVHLKKVLCERMC